MLETFSKQGTLYLATGTEAAAAVIIALAVIVGVVKTAQVYLQDPGSTETIEAIRLRLGRWLALALEFELAADILRTAVAPTWSEIGQLAAIIVLRTLLNYFLQREIDQAEQRGNPNMQPHHDGNRQANRTTRTGLSAS